MAAAGYYQGLASVRQHGMYSDTQQYVNDVMALQQRFGGPRSRRDGAVDQTAPSARSVRGAAAAAM